MRPFDIALAVLTVTLWGLNFIAAKIAVGVFPPLFLLAIRYIMVCAILLPFVRFPRAQIKQIAILACVLGSVHFPLVFYGVAGVPSSMGSIIAQLQVPFSSILAAIFYNDKLGWRRLGGMLVAFGGVVLVVGKPSLQGDFTAVLELIGASMAFACANIQIKRIGPIDGHALNAWMSLLALPLVLSLSWGIESGQPAAVTAAGWQAWLAVTYSAVFSTVVAYGAWYYLIGKYQVNQVVPFMLLGPVVSVAGGVLILGEPLSWRLIVGGALTIFGVGVIIFRRPNTVNDRVSNPT